MPNNTTEYHVIDLIVQWNLAIATWKLPNERIFSFFCLSFMSWAAEKHRFYWIFARKTHFWAGKLISRDFKMAFGWFGTGDSNGGLTLFSYISTQNGLTLDDIMQNAGSIESNGLRNDAIFIRQTVDWQQFCCCAMFALLKIELYNTMAFELS